MLRDGRSLVIISPPRALDAQGSNVPVSYEIDGTDLLIVTRHRSLSVAYPILVDPQIDVRDDWACLNSPNCSATWFHGDAGALQGLNSWYFDTNYDYPGYTGNTFAGRKSCYAPAGNCYRNGNGGPTPQYDWQPDGLHILMRPDFYYPPYKYGQWVYQPPGYTTQVYRTDFGAKFLRKRYGHSDPWSEPVTYSGIYSYATGQMASLIFHHWELTHNWHAEFGMSQPGPQAVVFGMQTLSQGAYNWSTWRDAYMGAAIIQLTDPEPPTAATNYDGQAAGLSGPTGWTNNGSWSVAAGASDPGLGVHQLRLDVPLAGGGSARKTAGPFCWGNSSFRCQPNLTLPYNSYGSVTPAFTVNATADQDPTTPGNQPIAEGEIPLGVTASDPVGHESPSVATPSIKVDRAGPDLNASGRLWDLRGKEVFADRYEVTIDATDGSNATPTTRRSGVERLDLYFDNQLVRRKLQTEAGDSAPLTDTWSLDVKASSLTPGTYPVRVEAVDRLGNPSSKEWAISVTDSDPLPTEAEVVQRSQAFREEFGLSTEEALIRSLMHDPAYTPSRYEYGVPLTAAEAGQIEEREARADTDHEAIESYGVQTAPGSYAGYWADPATGLSYVGFTADLDTQLAALRDRVANPAILRAVPAQYSLAALNTLHERILADEAWVEAQGLELRTVGVDVPANRIELGLNVLPDSAQLAQLRNRYGDAVEALQVTVEAAAARRDDYWPRLFGGLEIFGLEYGSRCTSGYAWTGAIGTLRLRGVLTAGHCTGLRASEDWSQGGVKFGTVFANNAYDKDYKSADAASVGENVDDARPIEPTVYLGVFQRAAITRVQPRSRIRTDQRVCLSGRTSGYTCGKVSSTYRNVVITNGALSFKIRLKNQMFVKGMSCDFGDSGGPIFAKGAAIGMMSAVVTYRSRTGQTYKRCTYSHAAYVQDETGATILTSGG